MSDVGSDLWIERFAAALADVEPGDVRITVLHRITDGPAWLLQVRETGVTVERAAADAPADVTFTWQQADADAVARGEASGLGPFQAGRLRVGGDLGCLRAAAELFCRFPRIDGRAGGVGDA